MIIFGSFPYTPIRFGPAGKVRPHRPAATEIAKAATVADVEKLAAKLEPALARAILVALDAQAEALDLDAVVAALEVGDTSKVLSMLRLEVLDAAMGKVEQTLIGIAVEAGAMTVADAILPTLTRAEFRFNSLAPPLINWLREYNLNLIREIDKGTKETVRTMLTAGMTRGQNPLTVAREIKQAVGLTKTQQAAVARFRKELETFHTRRSAKAWNLGAKVSKVHSLQVMKINDDGSPKDGIEERRLRDYRFDGQLQRAMDKKKPLTKAQIDKMVAGYRRKYLKYRSEMIARTEALRAANFGQQEAWRQAVTANKVSEALLRRRWIVAKDERLCLVCRAVPGMNPALGVKFGEPFATPVGPIALPPLHPSCRCTVIVRAYEPSQLQLTLPGVS